MQKEDFLKEVTRIFSTQKFDEINAFLKDNVELSLDNKKFIKTLNKNIGNDSVDKTFIELSNIKKNQDKALKADIINAFKNNDEESFFEKLSKFEEDKKINIDSDLLHHYAKNDYKGDLYNKYLYKLLEEMPSYSKKIQDFLGYKFINYYSTHRSDVGEKYCAITKNHNEYLYLLKDKAKINIFTDELKALTEEVKKSVNLLFDELAKDGMQENSDFYSHFHNYTYQIPLLSSDNLDKLIQTGLFNKDTIINDLINSYDKKSAIYFIENQKSPIDISLNTALDLIYAVTYHKTYKNIDLDKFKINKEINFDNWSLSTFALIFAYNENRGTHKQWKTENPDNIKKAIQIFDKFGLKDLQINDEQLNDVISCLPYDKIELIFKESNIFKLSASQKLILSNVLNNYDDYIVNKLNDNFPFNHEVISNFVNSHLDDNEFISKLDQQKKENLIKGYINFYDLKDSKSFIDNFASTLEIKPYSQIFYKLMEVNFFGKDDILAYILNEKINYDVVDLFGISKVFHLLNTDNKEKAIQASYNENDIPWENNEENKLLFGAYRPYSNKSFENVSLDNLFKNHCWSETVKNNFMEIQTLYNNLNPFKKKSPKL